MSYPLYSREAQNEDLTFRIVWLPRFSKWIEKDKSKKRTSFTPLSLVLGVNNSGSNSIFLSPWMGPDIWVTCFSISSRRRIYSAWRSSAHFRTRASTDSLFIDTSLVALAGLLSTLQGRLGSSFTFAVFEPNKCALHTRLSVVNDRPIDYALGTGSKIESSHRIVDMFRTWRDIGNNDTMCGAAKRMLSSVNRER